MKVSLVLSTFMFIVFSWGTTQLEARSKNADNGHFTSKSGESNRIPELTQTINPGLELQILGTVIPADRRTEVTFKLTDSEGLPLDREGIDTPGPVSTSFILAYIKRFGESYVAYTTTVQTSPITGDSAEQGSTDSGGAYTSLGEGTYVYKFGTVLPEDYDVDTTHSMGIYARRDLLDYDLGRYVVNELDHFVPSGVGAPKPRDIVTTETCNGRCHDPLALHGGSRQKIELCVLCHNPTQGIDPDTGNSVDMPLMIHKIHMGENLTRDYTIIGYRQSVHNYNDVVYPAPVNECEACHTGGIPTENFPLVATPPAALVCDGSHYGKVLLNWQHTGYVELRVRTEGESESKPMGMFSNTGSLETGKWIRDGTTFEIYDNASGKLLQVLPVDATVLGCVSDAPGTFRGEPGAQHTNWLDRPSRQSCGSCHDYINWETGLGHSEYRLAIPDDNCDGCHMPYTNREFGRSIKGSHLELYKSAQLPGVLINFLEITDTSPGSRPTVKFTVGSKNGWIDPNFMDRLRFTLSGPNEDFSFQAQETVNGSARWAGDNWWTYLYTFSTPLPDDADGSWTISAEGREIVEIDIGSEFPEFSDERDNAENPSLAFAVNDSTVKPRRKVVDDFKCESCHSNLNFHGGSRHDPDYCNTCHMPEALDRGGEQTIHFKYMIHSIHRGEDLVNGYTVGGRDYGDVVYPGDLRNCNSCHVDNSQQLPGPEGLLPTTTPQVSLNPMMPNSAACLSCHDGDSSVDHASSFVSGSDEFCYFCHGEGASVAVDDVHAR